MKWNARPGWNLRLNSGEAGREKGRMKSPKSRPAPLYARESAYCMQMTSFNFWSRRRALKAAGAAVFCAFRRRILTRPFGKHVEAVE